MFVSGNFLVSTCDPRPEYEGVFEALLIGARHHNKSYKTQFNGRGSSPFDALGPVGPKCKGNITSFATGDNEKRFCVHELRDDGVMDSLPQGMKPATKPWQLHGRRLSRHSLFSVGSNNHWRFEEAALASGLFTRAHVFDCTLSSTDTPKNIPSTIKDRVRFYPVCLSSTSFLAKNSVLRKGPKTVNLTGRRYATYTELFNMTGEKNPPALVKFDIEGWEWPVIPAMLTSPERLLPLQIGFELHIRGWPKRWHISPSEMAHGKTAKDVSSLMALLFRSGYLLIDRHDMLQSKQTSPHCSELLVARVCKTPPTLSSASVGVAPAGKAAVVATRPSSVNESGSESHIKTINGHDTR